MHPIANIPCAQVELRWDRAIAGGGEKRTRQLRGALAGAFRDDDLFHQHDLTTGKPLYRYPRVQYRWRNGHGIVVGWGTAAARLLALPWLDLAISLGEEAVVVSDAALTLHKKPFAVSDRLLDYRLESPLLLFNQNNYRRYQAMDERAQRRERNRLLVSNLLIGLRGLEVNFPERLYAALITAEKQTCYYKGEKMLGMTGEMVVNALLPDGFSFGRAVSHGFGSITQA